MDMIPKVQRSLYYKVQRLVLTKGELEGAWILKVIGNLLTSVELLVSRLLGTYTILAANCSPN